MTPPKRKDAQQLGKFYRVVAGGFFLCILLVSVAFTFILFTESFHIAMLVPVAVLAIGAHISGSVVFTGYAPRYLSFSRGRGDET